MEQLRDGAGQLVHHLTNEDVNGPDGLAVIMRTLEKSPIIRQLDRHRIDLHRKKLMQLRRLPGESLESYVTRGSIYRTQLLALDHEMQMGECFYTGHLLDNAKLTRKDKVMIKTKAGSDYEEDITNAMIELAAELEGEHGFPIGTSEPNAAARQGDDYLIQRQEANKPKKEAFAADFETLSTLGEVEDEPGDDNESVPELSQAEHEAFAMHFKARQKIAEVRKLRQYFRKPESTEERKKILAEKMRTQPCHRCGEFGHWSRECPQQIQAKGHQTGVTLSTRSADADWQTLVSMCMQGDSAQSDSRYKKSSGFHVMVNDVKTSLYSTLWCHHELRLHAILDLGCVRSVVGTEWINDMLKVWKQEKRWCRVFPESEVFQFGNGQTLKSRFNVHFEVMLATCHTVLSMSVVPGNCPPLLSRHACSQLGMTIDCGTHSFGSRRMNVKNYGLSRASNGHYLLPINHFGEGQTFEIAPDFKVPDGTEAYVVARLQTNMPKEVAVTKNPVEPLVDPAKLSHEGDRSQVPTGAEGTCVFKRGSSKSSIGGVCSARMPSMPRAGTSRKGMPDVGGVGSRRRGGHASGCGCHRDAAETGGNVREEGSCNSSQSGFDAGSCAEHSSEFGVGSGGTLSRGEEDDSEEAGESCSISQQGSSDPGSDWHASGLSVPVSGMELRDAFQSDRVSGIKNEDLPVEEDVVAASSEVCCGSNGRSLEEEPALAEDVVCTGDQLSLRPHRSNEAEDQRPSSLGTLSVKLQRGTLQRLKRGAALAIEYNDALVDAVVLEERYVLFEIYAGVANLTKVARSDRMARWTALDPVDICYGHDLTVPAVQRQILDRIKLHKPDLVTLSMPCGPWCSWSRLADADETAEKRTQDMPLWRFARQVWDEQVAHGRLVLTEQPWGSEGLDLTFMQSRPDLHRAKVAQCMWGLKDVVNNKPHRKLTALDVNREDFAQQLLRGSACNHDAGEHQAIEGKVLWRGKLINRSALAGRWPDQFCRHLLKSAQATLEVKYEVNVVSLAEEVESPGAWECNVVRPGEVPEEQLRQKLGELGVAADRYGYITFEGEGQQVPRRIRAAVAHLHSAMGHLSNERLVRMIMLSGGGEQILAAARNLRCQICSTIHPPRDAPQVAASRPRNFNEHVSGDTFYVWDVTNEKFAVVHYNRWPDRLSGG